MAYEIVAIPDSVFRAYDIRGQIGTAFSENAYYTIGNAIATLMKQQDRQVIYLGRDGRLTSPQLAKAMSAGLIDSGIDVIDLGEVTSPMLYFATYQQRSDCGVMVTGSHNPASDNGIKMVIAGRTLVFDDIQQLKNLIVNKTFHRGEGTYQTTAIFDVYRDRIVSDHRIKRHFKVVVDCGNGIAGRYVPEVLTAMGCTVIPLYCDVDGRFPNHHPDPTIEANLSDLKKLVKETQADIGFAFDGDADRLGVITPKGRLIWADRVMMMLSKGVLKAEPGATIVYDVKCSANLPRYIESYGGRPVMSPTGHSVLKRVMQQEKAALAGELSGHIFFKHRWFGFDDALYSACRLLELLSDDDRDADQQFEDVPDSVSTPEIHLPVDESVKFSTMQTLVDKSVFTGGKKITLDGMRVEFDKGWGLLRASNTTPCLVARFEADDELALTQIKQQFKQNIQQFAPQISSEF
ncbi:phosphomannomutase/phosphoglucomutase [Legionella sp. W05-934-2]|jgi:phosphomannomutase/phosphomannomutase/phosphoglucomutase|uniref:phosphomannomutase/phosphoglucomutase n=1 Tax=Legionella sp. W05-934-2 TaxID=1198649 RepID=UPI003462F9A2